MKLEDLVPPMEMCLKIPKGKFTKVALVWWGDMYFQHYMLDFRLAGPSVARDAIACPAPTLQEILFELPEGQFETKLTPEAALNHWLRINKKKRKKSK